MKTTRIIFFLTYILGATALTGCMSDEPSSTLGSGHDVLSLKASIGDKVTDESNTRAYIATGFDLWSYARFDDPTDTIGFYSANGNLEAADGMFTNEPMVYARGSNTGSADNRYYGVFEGVNMNYDVGLIQSENAKTFVYFPYAVGMDTKGLKLRREAADGSIRCVDALYVTKINDTSDGTLGATFYHNFSELRITRGYGFDNPPDDRITVVLSEGFSHVKVIDNPWTNHTNWKILQPVYNADCGMTEEECRRWDAWRGADIQRNVFDGDIPAYYVILPTGISSSRSVVDYIEICDNNGTWHKISSFYLLTANDKRLNPNDRYPIHIVLENLVPTIYPYTVEPWAENTTIQDNRTSGINSAVDFSNFILDYNRYMEYNRDPNYEGRLATYGDKYTTDGVVGWHFYINHPFDMASLTLDNYRITELQDTLDGLRNKVSNLRLNNNSGFIGTLKSGGCLMNFETNGLYVSNPESVNPTGGLVGTMNGGLISNCVIDGQVHAPGPVGLGVGSMSAGTIKGSIFSGILVGGSSYNNLFGVQPTGGVWNTGNNFSGIFFTPYNN